MSYKGSAVKILHVRAKLTVLAHALFQLLQVYTIIYVAVMKLWMGQILVGSEVSFVSNCFHLS